MFGKYPNRTFINAKNNFWGKASKDALDSRFHTDEVGLIKCNLCLMKLPRMLDREIRGKTCKRLRDDYRIRNFNKYLLRVPERLKRNT